MQNANLGLPQTRSLYLILIMVLISMTVLAASITLLYHTSFNEQRDRLIEVAQSRARLIEAVARFDQGIPGIDPFSASLAQIRAAHQQFPGFGDTGEFTLARLDGENIVFLINHRRHDTSNPHPVSIHALNAEPMRRALRGEAGSIIGLDYSGKTVLAAYEPVAVLNLGIVAKIDLEEIRAPFFRTSYDLTGLAILLVLIGSWVFRRITAGTARRIELSEKLFRETFANAAIGLAHVSIDGSWLKVNDALCEITGYPREELLRLGFQDITHPDDLDADLQKIKQTLSGKISTYTIDKRYIRKDGGTVNVQLTVSLVRDVKGEPDYFISAVADISELKEAMATIKTISGIVPLCAWCGHTIRDESGEWVNVDHYIHTHTNAEVSHGMCPECQQAILKQRAGKS